MCSSNETVYDLVFGLILNQSSIDVSTFTKKDLFAKQIQKVLEVPSKSVQLEDDSDKKKLEVRKRLDEAIANLLKHFEFDVKHSHYESIVDSVNKIRECKSEELSFDEIKSAKPIVQVIKFN